MIEETKGLIEYSPDEERGRALFEAIKRDDVKAFGAAVRPEHYAVVFGRFPLLSLLYLYDADRIVKKYYAELIKERPRTTAPSFREADVRFRERAGKPLRYFADKEVSPLEILAVLGRPKDLKKLYACYPNAAKYLPMIHKIYFTRLGKGVSVVGDKLNLPPEPLSFGERRTLTFFVGLFALLFLCFVGATSFLFVHYGVGTEDSPYLVRSDTAMEKALESSRNVVVKEDISLSSTVPLYSAKANGENHILRLRVPFAEKLTGTLENVIFVLEDDFEGDGVILENEGTLRNVRVVAEGLTLTQTESVKGLLTAVNTGTIESCYAVMNVSVVGEGTDGCFAPIAGRNEGTINSCHTDGIIKATDLDVAALVGVNEKEASITDCTVKAELSGASESGFLPQTDPEAEKESPEIAGIAVRNRGAIYGCAIEGSIVTKNMDLAGVVLENESSGTITNCTAKMTLRQDADIASWTPNVGGVSMHNDGRIQGCTTSGTFTSVLALKSLEEGEDAAFAYAAGIACVNGGTVTECKVLADAEITAEAENGAPMAGGIVTINAHYAEKEEDYLYGTVDHCTSSAIVKAHSDRFSVYAGGIVAQNPRLGVLSDCESAGEVASALTASSAEGEENIEAAYAGGIACINFSGVKYCTNAATVSAVSEKGASFAGGIVALNTATQYSYVYYVGEIFHCDSRAEVKARSDIYNTYAGGVAAQNHQSASIRNSCQRGSVRATSEKESLFDFTGGIVGRNYGVVADCFFVGRLDESDMDSAIGAISGISCLYVSGDIFFGFTYTLPLSGNAYVGGEVASGAVIVSGGNYQALRANEIYTYYRLNNNEGYDTYVDSVLMLGGTSVSEEELKAMEIYYD